MKPPAVVPLAWSPLFCAAIGLAHIGPFASVFAEGVPGWVAWFVAPICLMSGARAFLIAVRLRNVRLRPHFEGVDLILHTGGVLEGRMLASSVDMGALVVLHWQRDGDDKPQRFALLRDAFAVEDWRVLKVWLRWSVIKHAA